MDFQLSDDQKMLSRTVASFVSKSSSLARFRKVRDNKGDWDQEIFGQMGELGWLALPFTEAVGGYGGSMVDVGLIMEQLGKGLVPEPYLPSILAGMAIAESALDTEAKTALLAPMLTGEQSFALAHAERSSRYDLDRIEARAEHADDGYRITGEKVFVLNGHRADLWVVSALVDNNVGLFAVKKGAGGLTVSPVNTIDGTGAAKISMASTRAVCLSEDGLELLEQIVDCGAAAVVAEGVGVGQVVLDLTVDYMKTREQFGAKIGAFQAIQHRCVDMFVELELCRSMATLATIKVQDSDPVERKRAVSAAKAQLAAGGRFIANEGVQLHGGIGITDEHDVGLFFKRMSVLNALYGDEMHHLDRFSHLPGFETLAAG